MKVVNRQAGVSQIVLLVVIAVALAAAYVAIDFYNGGEKDMLTVETRGVQMISALSAYRRESGAYPEALDKLVPKHVPALSKCPGGATMGVLVKKVSHDCLYPCGECGETLRRRREARAGAHRRSDLPRFAEFLEEQQVSLACRFIRVTLC